MLDWDCQLLGAAGIAFQLAYPAYLACTIGAPPRQSIYLSTRNQHALAFAKAAGAGTSSTSRIPIKGPMGPGGGGGARAAGPVAVGVATVLALLSCALLAGALLADLPDRRLAALVAASDGVAAVAFVARILSSLARIQLRVGGVVPALVALVALLATLGCIALFNLTDALLVEPAIVDALAASSVAISATFAIALGVKVWASASVIRTRKGYRSWAMVARDLVRSRYAEVVLLLLLAVHKACFAALGAPSSLRLTLAEALTMRALIFASATYTQASYRPVDGAETKGASANNLDIVLNNEEGFALFRAFLEVVHCQENVLFWQQVQSYKATVAIAMERSSQAGLKALASDDSQRIVELLASIHERFLMSTSKEEVNVSSANRERVGDLLASLSTSDNDLGADALDDLDLFGETAGTAAASKRLPGAPPRPTISVSVWASARPLYAALDECTLQILDNLKNDAFDRFYQSAPCQRFFAAIRRNDEKVIQYQSANIV